MSGVIDEYGQWEKCNRCGKFVLIQKLCYEEPTPEYEHGRDLCRPCMLVLIEENTSLGYEVIVKQR